VLDPTVAVIPFEASESRQSLGSAKKAPTAFYGAHGRIDASSGNHVVGRVADPAGTMPFAVFEGV
jgi:hypothetical protein